MDNSPQEILHGLRIGCVAYLNARPLIEPYNGPVTLEHPSRLAADLECGALDVALVPAYEAFALPGFNVVDGISIAAFGPVWSVFVAHRGPLSAVRSIALDPASLTSANLCKLLFAEWETARPEYRCGPPEEGEARLLIGDQANAFRAAEGEGWEYWDLGEAWRRRTGLPFVFAVWLMRPEVAQPRRVGDAFREIAARGRVSIPEIAARQRHAPPAFALRYLTEAIRFDLGVKEREGLALFGRLLARHGLLPPGTGAQPLSWV